MNYVNKIYCVECGKFIVSEEEEDVFENIRCIDGDYKNGYYNGKEDIFYCKECAKRHGLEE